MAGKEGVGERHVTSLSLTPEDRDLINDLAAALLDEARAHGHYGGKHPTRTEIVRLGLAALRTAIQARGLSKRFGSPPVEST